MKKFTMLIMVIGIPTLLACAGQQTDGTGTKAEDMQITSRHIKDIAGIEWQLQRIKNFNQPVSLIKDTKNTFKCDENGKVAGMATINRYFGSFSLGEDGKLIWSKAFGMTRMAGPSNLMEQEAQFMKALPLTSRIYLKKGKLVLRSTDQSTVLEFENSK